MVQLKEVYFIVWILLTFAVVAFVTSLTTSHWRNTDTYSEGLFERCEYGKDGCLFIRFFVDSTGYIFSSFLFIYAVIVIIIRHNLSQHITTTILLLDFDVFCVNAQCIM